MFTLLLSSLFILFGLFTPSQPLTINTYEIHDLEDTTSYFSTEALPWQILNAASETKVTTCAGTYLLGGYLIPQKGTIFTRTYTSLASHNQIQFSFLVSLVDLDQATDLFQIYFDDQLAGKYDTKSYSSFGSNSACGGPKGDFLSLDIQAKAPHAASTLTIRIEPLYTSTETAFYVGFRNIHVLLRNLTSGTPTLSTCGIVPVELTTTPSCLCANGYDTIGGTTCKACNSVCDSCLGSGAGDCTACKAGYSFSGTKCYKCDASCDQCTGSGASQCLTCASSGFLYWNGTCQSKCETPLITTTEGMKKNCGLPCEAEDFLYQDGSCDSDCYDPFISSVDRNGVRLCNSPCGSSQFYYENNKTCQNFCEAPYQIMRLNQYLSFCSAPCLSSQYYFNETGNCGNSCDSPMVSELIDDSLKICYTPPPVVDSPGDNNTNSTSGNSTEPEPGNSTNTTPPENQNQTNSTSGDNNSTEPSQGNSTEPTNPSGNQTEPDAGNSTDPAPGNQTNSTSGEPTDPPPGNSTNPSPGNSTDNSPGNQTNSTSGGTTNPPANNSTNPSPGNSTNNSTGNTTDPDPVPGGGLIKPDPSKSETETETSPFSESTQKVIKGVNAIGQILRPTSTNSMFMVALAKVLKYTKYININLPEYVTQAFDSQNSTIGSLSTAFTYNMPESLKGHYPRNHLPEVFDDKDIHSSYLVNQWNTLATFSLVISVGFFLGILQKAVKRTKSSVAIAIVDQLALTMKWNFPLCLLINVYDDVTFFAILELYSLHLNSFAAVMSFLVCIAMSIFALYVVVRMFQANRALVKVKNQTFDQTITVSPRVLFYEKWRHMQFIYSGVKTDSLWKNSYFFTSTVRIILCYVIVGFGYSSPITQGVLLNIISTFMIIYTCYQRPIKDIINMFIAIFFELALGIVNACILIIAIMDAKEDYSSDVRNGIYQTILITNTVVQMGSNVFMWVYVILGVKSAWKATKTPGPRPKTSWLNCMFVIYMNAGMDFDELNNTYVEPAKPVVLKNTQKSEKIPKIRGSYRKITPTTNTPISTHSTEVTVSCADPEARSTGLVTPQPKNASRRSSKTRAQSVNLQLTPLNTANALLLITPPMSSVKETETNLFITDRSRLDTDNNENPENLSMTPNTHISFPYETPRDTKRLLLTSRTNVDSKNNLDSPQTSFQQATPNASQTPHKIFNGFAFPQYGTSTSIIIEESHIEHYGENDIALHVNMEPRERTLTQGVSLMELDSENNIITDSSNSFVRIPKEVKYQNLFGSVEEIDGDEGDQEVEMEKEYEEACSFTTNRPGIEEKRGKFMPINTKRVSLGNHKIGNGRGDSKDLRTPCFQIVSPNQLIEENGSGPLRCAQRTSSMDMDNQMLARLNLGKNGEMKVRGSVHRKFNSFMGVSIVNGLNGIKEEEK